MSSLLYSLSPGIRNSLNEIENMRAKIALFPLPHLKARELQWEATISRIYWSLIITKSPLTRSKIAHLLQNELPSRPTKSEYLVAAYHASLSYLDQHWYVTRRPVTADTIMTLYSIARGSQQKIAKDDTMHLNQTFSYLENGTEHPIIQAGIAQMELRIVSPFYTYNGVISRLLRELFLYKSGYSFRGLLILDEYWYKDMNAYKQVIKHTVATANLTKWLEFYTEGVYTQLSKAIINLRQPRSSWTPDNYFKLSARQKAILGLLSDPKKAITNRDIQRYFEVHQITASRDLKKMYDLRLLLRHGKGRSVVYTKA